MDDYILKVLKIQEGFRAERTGEAVKEKLEREEIVPGERTGAALSEEAVAEEVQTAAYEKQDAGEKTENLQSMLTRMEPVVLGYGADRQRERKTVWDNVEGAVFSTSFASREQAQAKQTLGPEGLSMFFQRDARRYS